MESHFRRVELQSQFALLRQPGNCPEGVYVTPTPSLDEWSAVIFVRKGYYRGAVLRFRILFPAAYPLRAPSVVFTKGSLVHPLVDPRTDQLALASGFPQWNAMRDSIPKLLFFIKGIFKEYHLSKLNEGLTVNGEAWRLYQANRAVFARLATQCASISCAPSSLYASSSSNALNTLSMAQNEQRTDEKSDELVELTFRELATDEAERTKQALFGSP